MDQVQGGEPHVRVRRRDVDPVVVVPERAGGVGVGVAVVLELARIRDVVGVAVVLRQRRRAVEVRGRVRPVAQLRVHVRQLVALPHDCRAAPAGDDRRARDDAVVSPEFGLQARQDLGADLPLGQFVVVGRRVRVHRLQHRRHGERDRERLGQPAGRDAVAQRQLRPCDPLGGQQQCGAGEQPQFQQLPSSELHVLPPEEPELVWEFERSNFACDVPAVNPNRITLIRKAVQTGRSVNCRPVLRGVASQPDCLLVEVWLTAPPGGPQGDAGKRTGGVSPIVQRRPRAMDGLRRSIQSAYVEAASSRRRCGARAGPSRGPSSPRLTSSGRERGGRRPRAERVRTLRGPSRRYCDRTAARATSLAYGPVGGPSDRLDAFPVRWCGDAGGVLSWPRTEGRRLDGPAIRSNAAEGHNREPLARRPVTP